MISPLCVWSNTEKQKTRCWGWEARRRWSRVEGQGLPNRKEFWWKSSTVDDRWGYFFLCLFSPSKTLFFLLSCLYVFHSNHPEEIYFSNILSYQTKNTQKNLQLAAWRRVEIFIVNIDRCFPPSAHARDDDESALHIYIKYIPEKLIINFVSWMARTLAAIAGIEWRILKIWITFIPFHPQKLIILIVFELILDFDKSFSHFSR